MVSVNNKTEPFYIATSRELSPTFLLSLSKSGLKPKAVITSSEELVEVSRDEKNGTKVFFPHWSKLIPSTVYTHLDCVVFHMTDLPYGRGGSPLQNLISRGVQATKISAFLCGEGIDTGPVYSKKDLDLSGSAEQIFERADEIIVKQIVEILELDLIPKPQSGEPTFFARRRPEESRIPANIEITQLYDHIRMLDAPGYPNAFIEFGDTVVYFTRAQLSGNRILAQVEIQRIEDQR
jgi:methionyl-tRNA formyltransferase